LTDSTQIAWKTERSGKTFRHEAQGRASLLRVDENPRRKADCPRIYYMRGKALKRSIFAERKDQNGVRIDGYW